MRKESSKIPLKINSFLCLRRFKVAFFLVWYVTIPLGRFSITDAKGHVNSYCGGIFILFITNQKIPPLIILSITIRTARNARVL